MAERKQQFLQDLYNATQTLSHPKITPILRGSCRMRGPVDDSNSDFHADTVKEYSRYLKNLNPDYIAEGGTCNVCFAPCSACLHINQCKMGSKVDERSGEASAENALSFSVNDGFPNDKSVECEPLRKSDASKNAHCEAVMNSDMSATSETTTVFPKVEDANGQEDHDHFPSCITGAEDTKLSTSDDRNEDGLVETPSETAGDVHLMKARENCSRPPLHDPNPDDLKENLLACPGGHLTSLSPEAVTGGPTCSVPAVNTMDSVEKKESIDKIETVMRSRSMPDADENSFESHPTDESDDSDVVEHDVKVCDICGDAGREDLLAICCRCSDGAEHTYCMREMVDKVPEGDWLCEECKSEVEMKNQRQEKISSVDASEKTSFGQANPENANFSMKSDTKGSDFMGNKIVDDLPCTKILGKRLSDDAEVFCVTKKRVLEPDIGSIKVSTSSGAAAISRNSSFKLLDRGKAKPTQHSSSVTLSAHDTATSPPGSKLRATQGLFMKSNSFSSLNMKPKIKLVDDFVPQKQRSVKSSASLDKKEGAAGSMSKSMSFRLTNSGRLNIGESKAKMASPKFSRMQETKGLKHTKDRNLFERKNSLPSQKVSGSLPMANPGALAVKNDQKLVSSAEPNSLSSARNFHDTKAIQCESRSIILSKSSSFAARTGSELPVSLGELKRQAPTNAFGVSSVNGNNGHDSKPNQGSTKEGCSSNSNFGERQPCNLNEGAPDSLSQVSRPGESINFGERGKDSSWSQSKQNSMNFGRTLSCRKCKEIGHLAQFCTADRPGSPAPDATTAKNPREMVEGKDKLKAAIEAAVLRKPAIYRKHRASDQSDDASYPNMNSEIATQDQVLDSCIRGNLSTSGEMQEGHVILGNSITECSKQETVDDIVKQFPVLSVEASISRTAGVFPVVPPERSSLEIDVPNGISSAASSLLKSLAVPDHEYIWQGVFEVNRNGEPLNVFDGIQAHLSTCASSRVLEAVNKFSYKIFLNAVPRLTMWPVQFQDNGVKEENVALFFFAKDLASYEKSYRVLLDKMMKNDLALKGSFDGFELMIFPSNQLPEKLQRWNALFFLWGVFRGKRTDCSHKPTFVSQGSNKSLASEVAVMELPCLSSSQAVKQGFEGRVSSEVTNNDPVVNVKRQDNKLESNFFSVVQSSTARSCGEAVKTSTLADEMRHTSNSLEEGVDSERMIEQELQMSVESSQRVSGFCKSQERLMDQNSHLSRLHSSHYFGESPACSVGIGSGGNIGAADKLDSKSSSQHQPRLEGGSLNQVSSCGMQNEIVKDNYRNCTPVDSVQRMPRAAYTSSSSVQSRIAADDLSVEEVRAGKKQKTHVDKSSSSDGLVTQIHGGHSGSSVQATESEEAFDRSDLRRIKGNAERYFFPVGPDPVKDVGLVGKLRQWKMSCSEEDRLQDRAPNLELALGAESKPMTQGTPMYFVGKEDKKINQDHRSTAAAAAKGDEEDISASLSLSLSFPFPDKEQNVKSLSNSEQLMPERRRVNTSLLLFGGLREK